MLFWFVGKDSGSIALAAAICSISGLLNESSIGSAGVVISVLIASVMAWAELAMGALSGKMSGVCGNSSAPTAGKFDRPQIIACHT